MKHNRQIWSTIEPYIHRNMGRIIVLTGARQVGKTTLVKKMFNGYHYLSIEDPAMRMNLAVLPASQWKALYPNAILDEVQKEPSLIESVKSTYDQYDDVRYILLGSSQILLLNKVKESLAGRCLIFNLQPLVLPEIQTSSWEDDIIPSIWQHTLISGFDQKKMLPSFMLDPRYPQKKNAWAHMEKYGSYPIMSDDSMDEEDKYLWLENYVKTYLERDVRDLVALRDLEPYMKLQRAIALHTGCLINVSSLATEIGVSAKTVKQYIEYLNISFQSIMLPSWERNKQKRLVKTPKIHCLDNGVLQAVLKKRGGLTGNEFESIVVSEIYKQANNIRANVNFYHLRTHDGKEVDLLIETQNGYYAFEIKMAEHVTQTDARHLRNLETILDKPLLHGFLLSNDNETHCFSDSITALNAAYLLG